MLQRSNSLVSGSLFVLLDAVLVLRVFLVQNINISPMLIIPFWEQSTCALVINFNHSAKLCFAAGILLFTWKLHCGLKFDRGEICTEVTYTTSQVMWTLVMKLAHTEIKFYLQVKSQTGVSSLRASCKRSLRHLVGLIGNN